MGAEITVMLLPSREVVCEIRKGSIQEWIYGQDVAGYEVWPRPCKPLEIGRRYEIRGGGMDIIEIEPTGEPRVLKSRCD